VTPGTPFHSSTVQPTYESAPKFAIMLSEMQQKQAFQSIPSLSLQDYSLQVPTSAENTPLAYEKIIIVIHKKVLLHIQPL